jgi:hypothetical protein
VTLESNAAESAEKSITCAVAKKGYACILAGGLKTIGDGPIAKVKYASRGCACGGGHRAGRGDSGSFHGDGENDFRQCGGQDHRSIVRPFPTR